MANKESLLHPSKRLSLFFDGTWDTPGEDTNVWRLSQMLGQHDSDGLPQERFYDEGIGTHWYDKLTGGAFGQGLSANVYQGYRWLMDHYSYGDNIYLFGFSRGAFTARSLAGMIARCGLLKPDGAMSCEKALERYKKGDAVRPIYQLKHLEGLGEKNFDLEERILLEHAWYHRDLITMVGVWDTVGSIGIPFGNIKGISRNTLHFHNTHLSTIVQHSYQALALDEGRGPYWAVLWTRFIPDQPDPKEPLNDHPRYVEQRWFSGSHGDVGGGYKGNLLPQRPLAWMQEKAKACGLAFQGDTVLTDDDLNMAPHDSYAEFMNGWWKDLPIPYAHRYVRWVQSEPVKKKSGWIETVNERIDFSVFRRCKLDRKYRPASLLEWAKRKNLDLEAIIDAPERYTRMWSPVNNPGFESTIGSVVTKIS